jgi:hypothetical protein
MTTATGLAAYSLHRSGEWLDCLGYALLADEWRGSAEIGLSSSG